MDIPLIQQTAQMNILRCIFLFLIISLSLFIACQMLPFDKISAMLRLTAILFILVSTIMAEKTALLIATDGSEEMEVVITSDVLVRGGVTVRGEERQQHTHR